MNDSNSNSGSNDLSINLADTAEEARYTSRAYDTGVTRMTPSDLAPGGSGILASAVHPQTGNPATRLTEETIVRAGGYQMALRDAERLGFVKRDAQGNYSELDAGTASESAGAEQEQQQDASDDPVAFDAGTEAFATEFASQVAPEVQQAAFERVLADGGTGNLDMQAAAMSGMSEGEYRSGAERIRAALQEQADGAIRAQGVEPQQFYEWAKQTQWEALKDAARRHFNGRNPNAYGALVKEYVNHTQPSSAALQRGGYETRVENGVEMVRIGDTWTTVTSAARAGLI